MWAHVGSCGLMWAHVGSCGLIWCVRLLFGRICDGGMIPAWGLVLPPSGMIPALEVWFLPVPFRLMWAHVGSCGLVWAHVGSCGLMWAHVVCLVTVL